jgi:hypothetical protein
VSVGLGVSEIGPPWGATRGVWPSSSLTGPRRGVQGRYFGGIVFYLFAILSRVAGAHGVMQGIASWPIV